MKKEIAINNNNYYIGLLKGLTIAKRKGNHLKTFTTRELNELEFELLMGKDYLVKEWKKDEPSPKTISKICRYLETPFGFNNWESLILKEESLLAKENKTHILNNLPNYSEHDFNLFLNERITFWITNFDELTTFNTRLKQDLIAFRQLADKKGLSSEDRQTQVQKLVEQKSMSYFGTPLPPACDISVYHEMGTKLKCTICDEMAEITRRGECPFCGINFTIWDENY